MRKSSEKYDSVWNTGEMEFIRDPEMDIASVEMREMLEYPSTKITKRVEVDVNFA